MNSQYLVKIEGDVLLAVSLNKALGHEDRRHLCLSSDRGQDEVMERCGRTT